LAFIISLILSFIALVFTYSSICGEKEAGTLRLMLAGSVPRYKVVAAKYLGVMFTIGIPLCVGLLVNLVIVISSNAISTSPFDWLKILTIILLSFLYLSIFVLLGLFISSRTAHSANCMTVLLLVWVGLVILIPSFGKIISDASGKTPTQAELDRRLAEVKKQSLDDACSGKFGKNAGVFSSKHPERCNPPATARWKNAETNAENQVFEGHLNKMMAPAIIGRRFTRISPTVLFQCGCEIIVGTGLVRFNGLYQQVKEYKGNLREYIRSKDSEDNDSLHLICASTQAVRDWKTMSHKPVDFSTVPKFQERDLALGESLQLAIWDIGLLVLFNLVFFAAAFVSFLRYDVR
jgi:ABC-type transport system involved in multi-copper enzyme maturation permease subunit